MSGYDFSECWMNGETLHGFFSGLVGNPPPPLPSTLLRLILLHPPWLGAVAKILKIGPSRLPEIAISSIV